MNTRHLVNIGLLLLVIALTSFILWNTNDNSYLHLKITPLNKNEINTITIPRDKGDIIIVKSNTGWFMQSPYTAPAHEFRINQLLNLSQLIANNSYHVDELDLSQFDLAPSDTIIMFNKTVVEFGKANPVSLMRYIKSGDKLFLAKDNLYPLLRSQPSSFISLSLIPESSKIEAITLPELTLRKGANKNWLMKPDKKYSADSMQSLIQAWQHAKAFGVHAYMERKHLGQVSIQLDSQLINFEITDNDPWLILARKDTGIEYHLDKSQIPILLAIPEPDTATKKTD